MDRGAFAPVIVEASTASSGSAEEAGAVTVELNGARVRIGSGASPTLAAAVLKALRP